MADLDLRPNTTTAATGADGRAPSPAGQPDTGQQQARIARDLHHRLGRMLGRLDVGFEQLAATGYDGEDLLRLRQTAHVALEELRTALQRLRDEAAPTGRRAEDATDVIVLDAGTDEALLSERQIAILQAIADGASTKQVARSLDITQKTVHNHLNAVYRRLDTQSLTHAVLSAMRLGIIALD